MKALVRFTGDEDARTYDEFYVLLDITDDIPQKLFELIQEMDKLNRTYPIDGIRLGPALLAGKVLTEGALMWEALDATLTEEQTGELHEGRLVALSSEQGSKLDAFARRRGENNVHSLKTFVDSDSLKKESKAVLVLEGYELNDGLSLCSTQPFELTLEGSRHVSEKG